MNHLPPCCASCTELDATTQTCRLLSKPTEEHRRRLLTMPCDVPRLLRQRFRGHGEDIGSDAIARWVDGGQDPQAIGWSFGDAPRDARLWLSSWPFRHLVRGDVQAKLVRAAPLTREAPPPTTPNPVLFARVAGALARVASLDTLGFSMMVDSFNGQFDLAEWRSATGAADSTNLERRLVALYRFATLFFDALGAIREPECRAALLSRRFAAGDPTEVQALGNLRDLLGKPNLRMSEFRGLYAQGVSSTFVVLRGDAALGRVFDVDVERGLLRALRVDERVDVDLTAASVKIIGELAPHLSSGGSFGADDHVALDRLALLAAAALDAPDVAPIARHLFICRDGRCASVLRWEVGGREAVRAALSGPMSEPPPNSIPIQSGPASPHVIYARDVLWLAFAQMAAADGKSIDELVDDAMTRYQTLREAAMLAPPPLPSVGGPVGAPEPAASVAPERVEPAPGVQPEPIVIEPKATPPEPTVSEPSPPAPTEAIASEPSRAAPTDDLRTRATRLDLSDRLAPPPPSPQPDLRPPPRKPLTTIPLDPNEPGADALAEAKAGKTMQGLGDRPDEDERRAFAEKAARTFQGLGDAETLKAVTAARDGTDPMIVVPATDAPEPASGDDRATPILPMGEEPKALVIPHALPVPGQQRGTLPIIEPQAAVTAPASPPKGETQSLVMTVPNHHKPSDFDPLPKIIINAPAPAAPTAPDVPDDVHERATLEPGAEVAAASAGSSSAVRPAQTPAPEPATIVEPKDEPPTTAANGKTPPLGTVLP